MSGKIIVFLMVGSILWKSGGNCGAPKKEGPLHGAHVNAVSSPVMGYRFFPSILYHTGIVG
jgi:hypothetical protein